LYQPLHAQFAKCTAKSSKCEHYVQLRRVRLCPACFALMISAPPFAPGPEAASKTIGVPAYFAGLDLSPGGKKRLWTVRPIASDLAR
jgi:hypothetical protein